MTSWPEAAVAISAIACMGLVFIAILAAASIRRIEYIRGEQNPKPDEKE